MKKLIIFATAVTTLALAGRCVGAQQKYLGSIGQQTFQKEWKPDSLMGGFFNQVTPENSGKWGLVEPKRGQRYWEPVDAMVHHAQAQHMLVKYHCLVWGEQQPGWTKTAGDMKQSVDGFMSDYFQRYDQSIDLVDVVNEPIGKPPTYSDQLGGTGSTGWDWVVAIYRRARQLQRASGGHAQLILNETGILEDDAKCRKFLGIVKILQDEKLMDGIGAQAHFPPSIDPGAVKKRLDMLAATGLPIHVSEFDFDIADDAKHKAAFAAMFSVFWEHPAVKGVTVWGHREGTMWRKNGYLVRKDGSDRAAMTWLRDYLKRP